MGWTQPYSLLAKHFINYSMPEYIDASLSIFNKKDIFRFPTCQSVCLSASLCTFVIFACTILELSTQTLASEPNIDVLKTICLCQDLCLPLSRSNPQNWQSIWNHCSVSKLKFVLFLCEKLLQLDIFYVIMRKQILKIAAGILFCYWECDTALSSTQTTEDHLSVQLES